MNSTGATDTRTASCSITLKRVNFGTITSSYGTREIGTSTIQKGYREGNYASIDVNWTSGDSSSKYYLLTTCDAKTYGIYKTGSGTLSY